MTQPTEATAAPDQITYMDTAAGTAVGLEYKQRFLGALGLSPGHTVVDIGCGPGTDLGRLADTVGEEDLTISRRFSRFVAGQVRNATIGRELLRLSTAAGFQVRSVDAIPGCFPGFRDGGSDPGASSQLGARRPG